MSGETKEKKTGADPLTGKSLAETGEERFNTLMRLEAAKLVFVHGSNAMKENFETSASRLHGFIMGNSRETPTNGDGSPKSMFQGK